MKKIFVIMLLLMTGFAIKAQTFSVTFTNQVNPCNNNGSVDAVVTGGTAPYTYEWHGYSNNSVLSTTSSLTNVGPGGYYVIVLDANSVSSQGWVYLQPAFQVYVSNVVQADCPLNNGSVTYEVNGGVAPYDYLWNTGQSFLGQMSTTSTLSNLAPGEYSMIVTDANGCVVDVTDSIATVQSVASFSVNTSATNSSCNDGTASVGIAGTGTAPYTYYWNTTPPQTTATAVGLNGNTYPMVTVTDANGCSAYNYAYVYYGAGALQVSGNVSNAVCPNNNGSINISVSNGTAPYTYLWNTGATTQDVSGLAPGHYTVTVTDNAGCFISAEKYIGEASNIYGSVTTTATNCSNNSGSATVSVSGGVGPYTYLWYNEGTTQTISNLGEGYYGVQITDANGCTSAYSSYGYVAIPQSCYSVVSGTVVNDMNGNCVSDANESGLPWQIIDLGSGNYTSTNNYGYYNYELLGVSTYNVSHTPMADWNLICPVANYTVTTAIGSNSGGNDFYDQPTTLQNDLRVHLFGGLARPGFNYTKHVSAYNAGTTTMTGTIEVTHDAQEVFMGGPSVISYNAVTRTITLAYNNLSPFAGTYASLNFYLPVSVSIGTVLSNNGVVYPVSGDAIPADNYVTIPVTVVGSYDPNVKEVSPAGIGASGLISTADEKLDYTIHFQNTGTYQAETVVITDTLDQDLDVNTFQLLGASHNVTWAINGPRIVTFTFNNIYLPDSTSNEPGSHGLVSYSIKQKPNLTGGTEIKNTAYIYFDFNAPIVTNTTLNTIQIVGIKENQFTSGISISPNPAQDKISITNKTKEVCNKVEILDITGKVVASVVPTAETVQLPELSSGIYILNAHYKSGIYKEKLVISK